MYPRHPRRFPLTDEDFACFELCGCGIQRLLRSLFPLVCSKNASRFSPGTSLHELPSCFAGRKTTRVRLSTTYQQNSPGQAEAILLVRVERVELSSPVWKTGIITVIRHPLSGAGTLSRRSSLVEHGVL